MYVRFSLIILENFAVSDVCVAVIEGILLQVVGSALFVQGVG